MSTYLRFVIQHKVKGMAAQQGFFSAAYTASRDVNTPTYLVDQINPILRWFESNLTVPKRFSRSGSKGHYRRQTLTLSWFKGSAEKHIEKAFELAEHLKQLDIHVDMIRTEKPGFIIYEDTAQVVAEPFSDTF